MLEPTHHWLFPAHGDVDPALHAAGAAQGLSPRMTQLLAARGIAGPDELRAWFGPPVAGLHDPRRLPDAEPFRDRLARARRDGELVLVFGDFDADGLTGLAILTLALRRLGVRVEPYVPNRLDEGHGLSLAAVEAARRAGASVIVTVDCGTTSRAEIAAAVAAGIDVLVTDHHRVPAELPPALAVVNPHRPDSTYPDRRLAGSGVAFKLAGLLLAGHDEEFAASLADLATIGTVADVAPIVGENRAIARLGLELLTAAPRPGLAALLARAGIAPSRVDLEQVAFHLAPRLNAAGRVGEAMVAARLLVTDDEAEASDLAAELDAANVLRRDLTKQAVAEARTSLDPGGAAVVRGPWPVGIVGLVAARLAEETGRPAIVGAELGETIRASCRSDGTLDLGATLEACADLLLRHGGHAGAAGFEIAVDRWDTFRERFELLAAVGAAPDPRRPLGIDLALPAPSVDYALYRELVALQPCGPGNPEPLVAVLGLTVVRAREASGGHSQLTLRRERDVLDGICFGRSDLAAAVAEGDRLDVVARLASRRFGGFESLQLEIRDAAPSGWHPEAAAILAATGAPGGLAAAGAR